MYKYLYILVFWLIIHNIVIIFIPIQGYVYILQIVPIFFSIFLCKNLLGIISLHKSCIFFLLLVIYHLCNCFLQVSSADLSISRGFTTHFGLWNAIFPCAIILCSVPFLSFQEEDKMNTFLKWAFLIYIVLGTYLLKVSGDADNRMKDGLIHPNNLAQASGMGLMYFAYLKFRYNTTFKELFLLSIIPILGIIMSTSRNGLLLVGIFAVTIIVAPLFSDDNKKKSIYIIGSVVIILIVASVCGESLLIHTEGGERMLESNDYVEDELETGTYLDLLGDRAWYYYLGWQNFVDNPIFGIGLWRFETYNDYPYPLHSEYMIHLAEGGIIGAILYGSFVISILKSLIKKISIEHSSLNYVLLMMFISYLVVGVTAREFYNSFFYPGLGVVIFNLSRDNFKSYEEQKY